MARSSDEDLAVSLERFDQQWTRTTVASDELSSDVPDGIYDAVIEDARVAAASTGRPQVIWTLRIQGGRAAGSVVTKNRVITDNTLPYLREDLEKCGLSVPRLSDLPDRLKELLDRPVSIDKRTKDGRMNIYFRWKAVRPAENDGGDDVPF